MKKAPTIVEGQRSCKRQPNSGRKYCMKDSECRKVCIEAEKATQAPTIVEGQRSCKRQPNSESKNCMKDSECQEVCIYAEKAMRATCDYTFPRRRCFCHFPC
ncbi:hypothetical protein HID58_017184 [Brassica napus]|uniref:Knottins-like domain-containing protein n=1 Tax=Brassica napus TaxID=3708 RepID=A0ABQ8D6D5_BRANA|nr:hypothetical protein HID58_017184 [Brassica napus]